MKKIDIVQEGLKIPKVEYDVYSKLKGNNLIKLNLTVCQNSKVDISVPVVITENLDKLNTSSGYYNDICYISISDSGSDITLKDRKNEFIKGNKTVCQDGCEFSEYDYNNKKAQCSCDIKKSSDSTADMIIDKEKLFKNFMDIKNIANIQLLKCYKSLFSKKGIEYNIGCFIIIPIFIFHLICIIIFYRYQFDQIKNKIQDIFFGIKNFKLIKLAKRKRKKNKKLKQIIPTINDQNQINKNKTIINEIIQPSNQNNLNLNQNPKRKKNKKSKKYIINNILNLGNNHDNFIFKKHHNNRNELGEGKTNIKKLEQIMAYNDQELNLLKYKSALKYDKRTYCDYYLSLIKAKHNLIFSFYYTNDYNSRIIKINLFFIGFVIYYTVNALFFNDDTMHKIYEDKGKFQFVYQLPQIIYSSIISSVLNSLLKLLALSENVILKFKKNKKIDELDKRKTDLNNKLHIKFILYFIVSTIFLLLFWYYLSMFCAIYRNTQIHLIKDTLISFGLSLLYPFGIYLLPGIFRIPSLSHKHKRRKKESKLYTISKVLQML